MPEVHRVSVEIGGTEISFETGWMAKQASGAVVVRSGDTVVLNTATAGNLRDVDFLPLTVDVEERMYAAGKIPGSFFKREGRAGEKATLIARMIDRPLRPLFPKGWRRETQLVGMPLSIDQVVSLRHPGHERRLGGPRRSPTSRSRRPVGAVRIGKLEGNFVINPTEEQLLESDLDLVVSGTEEAILMVEAGANEVPEAEILDALDIAHSEIRKLCRRAARAGREGRQAEDGDRGAEGRRGPRGARSPSSHGAALDEATQVEDKLERQDATKAVEEQVLEQYSGDPAAETYAEFRQRAQLAFDALEKKLIRERIAVQKKRPDGRQPDEIRRSTSRSSRCRARTARRSSPAARRRPCPWSPSAPRARRCGWTTSGSRRPSATSTTTTSRRSRWARPASCAAPSAATSATARSPSARWSR